MRALLVLVGLAALALVVAMSLGMISIDQTQTASLPSVKVDGGQAPEFKAEVGRIGIGSTEKTVTVPTVGTTEKTIELPTLEMQRADNAAAPQ